MLGSRPHQKGNGDIMPPLGGPKGDFGERATTAARVLAAGGSEAEARQRVVSVWGTMAPDDMDRVINHAVLGVFAASALDAGDERRAAQAMAGMTPTARGTLHVLAEVTVTAPATRDPGAGPVEQKRFVLVEVAQGTDPGAVLAELERGKSIMAVASDAVVGETEIIAVTGGM